MKLRIAILTALGVAGLCGVVITSAVPGFFTSDDRPPAEYLLGLAGVVSFIDVGETPGRCY
jgi:hypothetical protein